MVSIAAQAGLALAGQDYNLAASGSQRIQRIQRLFRGAAIRTIVLIVGALIAALFTEFAAYSIAGVALPCHWFGSNFEGACGYGAMFASIGIGMLVGAIVFGSALFLVLRAGALNPEHAEAGNARVLSMAWFCTLACQLMAGVVLSFGRFGSMIETPALLLGTAAFIAVSAALARRTGKNAALALLGLIPYVGPILVAVFLFRDAARFASRR